MTPSTTAQLGTGKLLERAEQGEFSQSTNSRWPHRAAVAVALATFPLIWAGGLVTTTKAGMAVPDWPNTYGYNMFLYPMSTWLYGPWDLFIEHGHRLLGTLLGMLAIGLVIATSLSDSSRWIKLAAWVFLLAVIAQGVLGGMRVVLGDRLLAMVHGTTGPLVFAGAVSLAVATSRHWLSISQHASTSRRVAMLAAATLGLVYCQIAIGAWLRHMPATSTHQTFTLATLLHLAVALLIVGQTWLLGFLAWHDKTAVRWSATFASLIVSVQVVLGLATWMARYGLPYSLSGWASSSEPIVADGFLQSHIVTAHQATGSLLLVTLVVVTLPAFRTRTVKARIEAIQTSRQTTRRAIHGVTP